MGNLCWGAPLHRFMTRSSNEFPDVRVQYHQIYVHVNFINSILATIALISNTYDGLSARIETPRNGRNSLPALKLGGNLSLLLR